jgi:hypothetical protein
MVRAKREKGVEGSGTFGTQTISSANVPLGGVISAEKLHNSNTPTLRIGFSLTPFRRFPYEPNGRGD